jgi:TolB protein
MATRRVLLLMIGGLAALILVSGVVLAILAFNLFRSPTGTLLVLNDTQELHLLNANGNERLLADDASNDLFRYPSVSPDGRTLAYVGSDEEGIALFSQQVSTGERKELYRLADNPPMYLSWSPDGQYISFLSNLPTGGLGIHVVRADGSRPSDLIGTTLGSSYFAWRPDSGSLLVHTGGNQMQEGRISTYQPGQAEPEPLRTDPGLFQAPAWSMSGGEFYYVAQPAIEGALTIETVESELTRVNADGSNPQVLVSEPRAAIFFTRQPDGDQIAYTTVSPEGFGQLKLINPADGSATVLSSEGQQVAAFFWAPNGQRIAYISVGPSESGAPQYTWHVSDLRPGVAQEFESFTPSRAFAGMVSYFDAYAFSLQLWSANSTELVYATQEGIYVLDTTNGRTRRAADGVLAMWM